MINTTIQPDDPLLTPLERLSLFHDGSMTKFLSLLHNCAISVKVLAVTEDVPQKNYLFDWKTEIKGEHLVFREVILQNQHHQYFLYARSIWTKQNYELIMKNNANQPIGNNMNSQKLAQFRDIKVACHITPDPSIPTKLPEIKARAYIVHTHSQPLFYCEEFFI